MSLKSTKDPVTTSAVIKATPKATGAVSKSFADIVAVKIASLVGTAISNDTSLMSAGLDSITATELVQSLSTAVRTNLPSTLVFDHPSVSAIASGFAPMV